MSKPRSILQPQYVKDFECIGAACEDSCCDGGWDILIDKDTYKKHVVQPWLRKSISRNRKDESKEAYGRIKLDVNGRCPFLDASSLCKVHRQLGDEYLSLTCSTYPRITNYVDGVVERSMSLSCPEAARKALLNPDPMEFDQTLESTSTRIIINRVFKTSKNPTTILRHYWEVRIFIISLLQNRSLKLWERLVILGLFCQRLEQEGQNGNVSQIVTDFANSLETGAFAGALDSIPNEVGIQLAIIKKLMDKRVLAGGSTRRLVEYFAEFLLGLQYMIEDNSKNIGQNYLEAYNRYYEPLMTKHEYILENYLVNYVYKSLFPVVGQKDVFDNFVLLTIHYAMIKMLLIGVSGFQKDQFDLNHVIGLIQSFAKAVEHSDVYLNDVMEMLREREMNTMAYMAILIKN